MIRSVTDVKQTGLVVESDNVIVCGIGFAKVNDVSRLAREWRDGLAD